MADFASLDGMGGNIPTNGASADRLQLTTPNSMITGTMAGLQQIGSPSLTVDSVKNLITVKPISTANTQILRYGQVATGFLGMAVNDGTNDTMFAGQDNTGATVVKIAKSGFDAKTASAANLIFNSSQDVLKVVTSGTTTITVPLSPGAGNTFNSPTITHNLGFVPVALAFVTPPASFSTETAPAPWTTYLGTGVIAFIVDFNETTSTIIDFYALNIQATNTFSGVWTIKYYLLQETTT